MGTGIVVGGIILLIIGVGAYSYLGGLKTQAEQGIAACQSILGQAGQFILPEVSQKCQQAQQFTPAIQAGYYLGIALAIIGFIITIGGGIGIALRAARRGAESTKRHESNVQESSSEKNDQIFCRSCGKQRQISGEYCPFCGRSSRSLSTTMKRCINCDFLTGEDSLFCANCGHQDFRPNIDHIAETNRSNPKRELDKSVDNTIDNSGKVLAKSKTKKKSMVIIISGIVVAGIIIALIYHSISNVSGSFVSPASGTTYYNGTYGMQIQYPSNWSVEGTNGSSSVFAWFFSPVGSNNAATVGLGTETLNNSTTNLNNYALYSINGYENNQNFPSFRVIGAKTNSSLDGNPAYTLIGTYEDPSKGSQKVMEIGTIIGNKVYYLRYEADASTYSDYLPTAQKIIDSLHTGN